jgi:hypothetical protein
MTTSTPRTTTFTPTRSSTFAKSLAAKIRSARALRRTMSTNPITPTHAAPPPTPATAARSLSLPLLAALAALALGGCALDDAAAPAESVTEQHFEEECPNFACGQNGPSLSGHPFHELSEAHVPNLEGFTLGMATRSGASYELRVSGWELRAYSAAGTLTGANLKGTFFLVTGADGTAYRVWIADYSTMQIFAGPLKGTLIQLYVLKWVELTPGGVPIGHYQNLCSNPPTGAYREDTLYQPAETTVIFEGNRYDAQHKLVSASRSSWFNFGCAGNALAKLLLTGHTSLTGSATLLQQQAVLKMIVADYCGDGQTFTVAGEPLYWKTQNLYMSFLHTPESLEGRWGPDGPLCIDNYRLKKTTSALAALYFPLDANGEPDILAAVAQHCPANVPPACNALPGNYDLGGGYSVSANPVFVP